MPRVGKPDAYDVKVLIDDAENVLISFPKRLRWCPDVDVSSSSHVVLTITYEDVLLHHGECPRPKSDPSIREVLGWGDLTLEGHESLVSIERKYSLLELKNNLFGPMRERSRFLSSLDRLSNNVKFPYLLLDLGLTLGYRHDYHKTIRDYSKRKGYFPTPERIWDVLFQHCHGRGISIIGPVDARTEQRRAHLGDYLLRLMLSHTRQVPINKGRKSPRPRRRRKKRPTT